MKNIAVINCNKATDVCAGVACMTAFNEKRSHFAAYGDEELKLTAFMMCRGCDYDIETDEGLQKKLDRLVKSETDAAHFGVCTKDQKTGEECANIGKIAKMIEDRGIAVVRGTH